MFRISFDDDIYTAIAGIENRQQTSSVYRITTLEQRGGAFQADENVAEDVTTWSEPFFLVGNDKN